MSKKSINWEEEVLQFEKSNLSVADFCENKVYSKKSFYVNRLTGISGELDPKFPEIIDYQSLRC